MPFVPVPGTVLVEERFTQDSQHVENTQYFTKSPAWTAVEATALATDMGGWWVDNVAPHVSDHVVLNEVVVTDLSSATGFQVSITPGLGAFGAIAEAQVPNMVTLAVSFRTAQRGRSFRGRNYIIGLTIPFVNDNRVAGTFIGFMQAAYDALFPLATAHDCAWTAVSRFSGVNPTTKKPIPRATGIATPITTVLFSDDIVDSQTRRGPTRGK